MKKQKEKQLANILNKRNFYNAETSGFGKGKTNTESQQMGSSLHRLKYTNNYNSLFLKTGQKKLKLAASGKELDKSKCSEKSYKIKVERAEVPSMSKEEFMKKIICFQ